MTASVIAKALIALAFESNPNALLVYSNHMIPCIWFKCKTRFRLVLGAQSNHFFNANSFL